MYWVSSYFGDYMIYELTKKKEMKIKEWTDDRNINQQQYDSNKNKHVSEWFIYFGPKEN